MSGEAPKPASRRANPEHDDGRAITRTADPSINVDGDVPQASAADHKATTNTPMMLHIVFPLSFLKIKLRHHNCFAFDQGGEVIVHHLELQGVRGFEIIIAVLVFGMLFQILEIVVQVHGHERNSLRAQSLPDLGRGCGLAGR